jgi:hypothetical protein
MKIAAFGATALALVALTSLSSAMADGPRPSGGNTWHGMSQPADTNLVRANPHYELQYHYAGHHPRWAGQWVLVR